MVRDVFAKGVVALGLTILTACGGGGAAPMTAPMPDPDPVPPPTGGDTLAQLQAGRDALLDSYTDPTNYTALGSVPTSGSATYDGYFYGDLANTSDTITDTLIGQLEMAVTFTNSSVTISGTVDNVVDADSTALSGSLLLDQGSLDRSGNPSSDATLRVRASGTLTDDQGRDLVIGTQLEGDFLATGHRAVGGEVLGRITVDGITQDFDGGFVADR